MKEVGVGIIGTGGIAKTHADAIRACERTRLVAVHDIVPERAAAFAAPYGAAAEPDLARFLARTDLQAVTVATPSGAHADGVIPAARAGKHVLCEKPLEVTVAKIDRMLAACEDAGVVLACVFQSRTNRHIQLIRDALTAGRFGKLLLIGMQAKWFRTQEYYDSAGWRGTWALDGGGAVMNQSIHFVDLLLHLGGPVQTVFAFTDTMTHRGIEVEDNAVACLRFANGAMGTIEASTSCYPGFPRRLEVSGDRGSVVLEGDRLTRWDFGDKAESEAVLAAEAPSGPQTGSGMQSPHTVGVEGHRRQIQDFVDAILEGRSPLVPGREGRAPVELICALYESARTGQAVRLGCDIAP